MRRARSMVDFMCLRLVFSVLALASGAVSGAPGSVDAAHPGAAFTRPSLSTDSRFADARARFAATLAGDGEVPLEVDSSPIRAEPRVRIAPSSKAHNAIVYLEVRTPRGEVMGYCSGTIIGAGVVLTAAHCVTGEDFDGESVASLRVVPGKAGFTEPFGSQVTTRWRVPAAYREASTFLDAARHDYALVFLPDNTLTDRTGVMPGGIVALSDIEFRDQTSRTAAIGYPYDCDEFRCGMDELDSLFGQGDFAWFSPATFVSAGPNLIHHDAELFSGNSGGAMVRTSDLAVTGIVSSQGALMNVSVRITPTMISEFNGWCSENGCALSLGKVAGQGPRQFRLVSAGISTDSAIETCAGERLFLQALTIYSEAWTVAALDFFSAILDENPPPGSPAWLDRLQKAWTAFEKASADILALDPPDARFTPYLSEVDEGLLDYKKAFELLKAAFDTNSDSELDAAFDLIDSGDEHMDTSERLYPGLDGRCLPSTGSPFGPPPAAR